MKEKGQSSIEWLIEELKKEKMIIDLPTTLSIIFEQAKKLHKNEIIQTCEDTDSTVFWVKYQSYEQYYNEKYK